MLPELSKIMDTIIITRLISWCVEGNVISSKKFGFVSSRGVELALLHLTQYYMSAKLCHRRAGRIQVDLQAAFDLIPHSRLIHKLLIIGVPTTLVKWIQSFLNERIIEIVVGGRLSLTRPTGVLLKDPRYLLCFLSCYGPKA